MSSLGESSAPKLLKKYKFEHRNHGSDRFPPNFKRRKVSAIRHFPPNCGPSARAESPLMIHRELNTGAESASPATMDGSRSVAAILATPSPLISLPSTNVKRDNEHSPPAHGKDDTDAQSLARDEVRGLDALLAQASKYLSRSNVKPSSCIGVKSTGGTDPLGQTPRRQGTVRDKAVVAGSLHEAGPPMVARERTSNQERMPEDNAEADILLAAECKMPQPSIKRKSEDSMVSVEKMEIFSKDDSIMQDLEGNELTNCELVGNKCEETQLDCSLVYLDASGSFGSEAKFIGDGSKSTETWPDDSPLKCKEECKDLINLSIVKHDEPQGHKVRNALKVFEQQYAHLLMKHKSKRSGGFMGSLHCTAGKYLKERGLCLSPEKPFGHIPGVEIGDVFTCRAELLVIGLHCQFISGIDYIEVDNKICATSIVESGRYENQAKSLDVLIYTGQGGNPKVGPRVGDQKLERGNLALMHSKEMGYPLRVIYKRKGQIASNASGKKNGRNNVYVYDGLYIINRSWEDRGQNGKLAFKFELHRMEGQPRANQTNVMLREKVMHAEVCMVDDISRGKEKLPVRAMNGVDDDRMPPSFNYITNIMYGSSYEQAQLCGCDCINGCSDSHPCSCVLKNGGEIPFNEKGKIIGARPIVHECGPSCKCPPSCMNRVSQHGLKCQLEIFKTTNRGWGVRSRSFISSGRFVCEYVGELLRDNEAAQKVEKDEYLFDIGIGQDGVAQKGVSYSHQSELHDDGFAIDAAKFGNIGRFINHSCSPNLYAQEVLYDHDDKRKPHIMFFAIKDISPLRELTYDYNYKMDRVCDGNGNVKTKDCYCGSRECTGRMY